MYTRLCIENPIHGKVKSLQQVTLWKQSEKSQKTHTYGHC